MASSNVSLYVYKDEQFKSRDTKDYQSFWQNTSFFTQLMKVVLTIQQLNLRQCLLYHRLYPVLGTEWIVT